MKKYTLILLTPLFLLSGCSSDNVKDEDYQFAGGVKLLDVPPELTGINKNLVMEIPKPSAIACEKLMKADRKFREQLIEKEADQALKDRKAVK